MDRSFRIGPVRDDESLRLIFTYLPENTNSDEIVQLLNPKNVLYLKIHRPEEESSDSPDSITEEIISSRLRNRVTEFLSRQNVGQAKAGVSEQPPGGENPENIDNPEENVTIALRTGASHIPQVEGRSHTPGDSMDIQESCSGEPLGSQESNGNDTDKQEVKHKKRCPIHRAGKKKSKTHRIAKQSQPSDSTSPEEEADADKQTTQPESQPSSSNRCLISSAHTREHSPPPRPANNPQVRAPSPDVPLRRPIPVRHGEFFNRSLGSEKNHSKNQPTGDKASSAPAAEEFMCLRRGNRFILFRQVKSKPKLKTPTEGKCRQEYLCYANMTENATNQDLERILSQYTEEYDPNNLRRFRVVRNNGRLSIQQSQAANPRNRGANPQNRPAIPQNHEANPQNEQNNPQNEQNNPQSQPALPQNQEENPHGENEEENPLSQPAIPQNQEETVQNEQNNPQDQPAVPQNRPAIPQNQEANPQNEQNNPQNEQNNPQSQPVIPQNQEETVQNEQNNPQDQPAVPQNQEENPQNENENENPQNRPAIPQNQDDNLQNEQNNPQDQPEVPQNQEEHPQSENEEENRLSLPAIPQNQEESLQNEQNNPQDQPVIPQNQEENPHSENEEENLLSQPAVPQNQEETIQNEQNNPQDQQNQEENPHIENEEENTLSQTSILQNQEENLHIENEEENPQNQSVIPQNPEQNPQDEQNNPQDQPAVPQNQEEHPHSENEEENSLSQPAIPQTQEENPQNQQLSPTNATTSQSTSPRIQSGSPNPQARPQNLLQSPPNDQPFSEYPQLDSSDEEIEPLHVQLLNRNPQQDPAPLLFEDEVIDFFNPDQDLSHLSQNLLLEGQFPPAAPTPYAQLPYYLRHFLREQRGPSNPQPLHQLLLPNSSNPEESLTNPNQGTSLRRPHFLRYPPGFAGLGTATMPSTFRNYYYHPPATPLFPSYSPLKQPTSQEGPPQRKQLFGSASESDSSEIDCTQAARREEENVDQSNVVEEGNVAQAEENVLVEDSSNDSEHVQESSQESEQPKQSEGSEECFLVKLVPVCKRKFKISNPELESRESDYNEEEEDMETAELMRRCAAYYVENEDCPGTSREGQAGDDGNSCSGTTRDAAVQYEFDDLVPDEQLGENMENKDQNVSDEGNSSKREYFPSGEERRDVGTVKSEEKVDMSVKIMVHEVKEENSDVRIEYQGENSGENLVDSEENGEQLVEIELEEKTKEKKCVKSEHTAKRLEEHPIKSEEKAGKSIKTELEKIHEVEEDAIKDAGDEGACTSKQSVKTECKEEKPFKIELEKIQELEENESKESGDEPADGKPEENNFQTEAKIQKPIKTEEISEESAVKSEETVDETPKDISKRCKKEEKENCTNNILKKEKSADSEKKIKEEKVAESGKGKGKSRKRRKIEPDQDKSCKRVNVKPDPDDDHSSNDETKEDEVKKTEERN